MHKNIGYRVLLLGLTVAIGMVLCGGSGNAQQPAKGPTVQDLYCTALVTDQAVPRDTYVISGEDSHYKNTFQQGNLVYINRGGEQGVKVGDPFEVTRPERDLMPNTWFKWQAQLTRAMGTTYADIGRLRVVHVLPKTSIAEITDSCDMMQRGDIVHPFVARSAPAFHTVQFDPFAAPSGKKTAMIVNTKNFGVVSAGGRIIFVNLGSAQGVQVGDYFRVFRYQGEGNGAVYQERDTAYKVFGFGSAPIAYKWDDLPRQVMGEGIVLRTGPNSSTVLLTTARKEIYAGDYVELE